MERAGDEKEGERVQALECDPAQPLPLPSDSQAADIFSQPPQSSIDQLFLIDCTSLCHVSPTPLTPLSSEC